MAGEGERRGGREGGREREVEREGDGGREREVEREGEGGREGGREGRRGREREGEIEQSKHLTINPTHTHHHREAGLTLSIQFGWYDMSSIEMDDVGVTMD